MSRIQELQAKRKEILNTTPTLNNIGKLLKQHTHVIDALIQAFWQACSLSEQQLSIYATGSYARKELFIYSDIDLVILYPETLTKEDEVYLGKFITMLWDNKLQISHYITSFDQIKLAVKEDLHRYTNFLELRWISGNKLSNKLISQVLQTKSYSEFYTAKLQELQVRHKNYGETSYLLEPNIKESPGGLRDIQVFSWLSTRYNYASNKSQININNLLIASENLELQAHYKYFCFLRWTLHFVAQRPEDRLLFEHQKNIAKFLNYAGNSINLKVENLMREFYLSIKKNNRILDILHYQTQKKQLKARAHSVKDNNNYVLINNYIDIINIDEIMQDPSLLFKLFQDAADLEYCEGFTVNSIRFFKNIQENFYLAKNTAQLTSAFLDFLEKTRHLEKALRFMHRYGLLGIYLPDFHRLTGLMQFDLFHVYTVDKHLLMTIKVVDSFNSNLSQTLHPLCYKLNQTLKNKTLLRLAALFHDIGKGLNSEHSASGAKIAKVFCERHNLPCEQTALLLWLVNNHLLMSLTAQKKDIYDSEVIEQFAQKVETIERLNYLYLLTVADITATNPNLWNSWKSSLLRQLYHACLQCFQSQSSCYPTHNIASLTKQKALKILSEKYSETQIIALWQTWPDKYFLRHEAEVIARHVTAILETQQARPIIVINQLSEKKTYELFVYMKDKPLIVCNTTSILDKLHLNVVEAQILTTKNHYTLDSYVMIDTLTSRCIDNVKLAIIKALDKKLTIPKVGKRLQSRRQKQFSVTPEVFFNTDKDKSRTIMSLIAKDQAGLLASITRIFAQYHLQIQHAKILTVGERAEDVFYMTENKSHPLTIETQEKLKETILKNLGGNND